MELGRGMLYQYVKKVNLGGGHPIIEQPLAQQQQAQFKCTQLEDIVEYNVIPIPNLYIIPQGIFVVVCHTKWSKKSEFGSSLSIIELPPAQ
jgi:hypothetical protein